MDRAFSNWLNSFFVAGCHSKIVDKEEFHSALNSYYASQQSCLWSSPVKFPVQADTDDGQQLLALNEIYVGHASHQTARYVLTPPSGQAEPQASSGVIVSTGTGATGWCRSAWLERHSPLTLPGPADRRLTWFVREAWPSPTTGTAFTEGILSIGQEMEVTAESDRLVLFGDGIEADTIPLTWGQSARLRLADRSLRLL